MAELDVFGRKRLADRIAEVLDTATWWHPVTALVAQSRSHEEAMEKLAALQNEIALAKGVIHKDWEGGA